MLHIEARISAAVSHLLCRVRPTAIRRSIVSFIVDPIQSARYRAFSHIRQKTLEVFPSGRNLDPPAAIIFPVFRTRICTAIPHSSPTSIRWRSISTVFEHRMCSTAMTFDASATPRMPREKMTGRGNAFLAAITNTKPMCFAKLVIRHTGNHTKSRKGSALQVEGILS